MKLSLSFIIKKINTIILIILLIATIGSVLVFITGFISGAIVFETDPGKLVEYYEENPELLEIGSQELSAPELVAKKNSKYTNILLVLFFTLVGGIVVSMWTFTHVQ